MTIVFAALAITRYIEDKTGMSIKKFLNMLRPLYTAIISIEGVKKTAPPMIPEDTLRTVEKLYRGRREMGH